MYVPIDGFAAHKRNALLVEASRPLWQRHWKCDEFVNVGVDDPRICIHAEAEIELRANSTHRFFEHAPNRLDNDRL
jgi:hypothetical protein